MPKPSRRNEVLEAALEAFMVKGYEGASVADIVSRLGMSKAAFAYHVDSKEELLIELVEPLLDAIDAVLDRYPRNPSWPEEGREMLGEYLDVLIERRDLVIWIDGDKAVLHHPLLGKRLAASNRRLREAIRGDNRSAAARLGSSAALGTLWRPLRNLTGIDVADERESILDAAMAVVRSIKSS